MTTLTLSRRRGPAARRPARAAPTLGMAVLTLGLLLLVVLYAAAGVLVATAVWSALT